MTTDTKVASVRTLAATIVMMEEARRELSDDLAHHRSLLRNILAGQKWRDDDFVVDFRPGYYAAVPVRRLNNGIVFKRVRRDPYMKVVAK